MHRHIIASMALALFFAGTQAAAREYRGIEFPDTVKPEGSNVELRLNGIGVRTKLFFKIYIGALYTTGKAVSRDAVQALEGPNRVMMHFLYDEVEREKLVSAWNEGFQANSSPEQLAKLQERIERFNRLFKTAVAGDVILLDYIPGEGTRVIINGERMGVIEGRDFNTALLDIWLGDEPADSGLKEGMLGVDE